MRARKELPYSVITLGRVHVTVYSRDSKVAGSKLISKPFDLPTSVAENHYLSVSNGLVKTGKAVDLLVFLFVLDSNVGLFNTLKASLVLLNCDADWITHELSDDL